MRNLAILPILALVALISAIPAAAEESTEQAPRQAVAAESPPAAKAGCHDQSAPSASADACWDRSPSTVTAEVESATGATGAVAGTEAPSSKGWRWRGFNAWEYTLIGGAAGAALYLEMQDPATPRWSARNDFDEGIRNALRLGGVSDRNAAYTAGDVMMALLIAAPEIDSFIYQGYRDRDWESMYHTNMINLESFTFTSLVSVLLQTEVRRERPFVRTCRGDTCEFGEENRSFPSGHAAYAFTGAGLLCTHHEYQHYYHDPDLEDTVCWSALGVASVDSITRIMADTHYATDVIAGAGIGIFSGFLLPRLLHYWHPAPAKAADTERKTREPERRFEVAPTVIPGSGAGLLCRYTF